ncbi:hypothetical protein DEIGR_330013 [Deinococcus grandis]|uniref:Uncharacterized protein n=1 Tax=Deinococcus grandis TaxID=57498 RepID=A0A100HN36_9DEIO|nr:hypothetical protein [Deinococcus grandis]BBN96960.1 hypothetical protein DEGR_36930 [Deinococcus grandis]GAQ23755.1 hypothetical protein DEIGR_330013 [Deinococcus grandis]
MTERLTAQELHELLRQQAEQIRRQAEQIERLQKRIEQLERQQRKYAAPVLAT